MVHFCDVVEGGGGVLFSDVNVVSVSCITSTGDCTCPQHQQTTVRRQSEGVRNVHVDLKQHFINMLLHPSLRNCFYL